MCYRLLHTLGWGGKAQLWSWPLTKIQLLMYFLVLKSIFGSKYPIFVEPITIKFQKTFFQAVTTKKFCLLELGWSPPDFVRVSVKQTILPLFTSQMRDQSAPLFTSVRWPNTHREYRPTRHALTPCVVCSSGGGVVLFGVLLFAYQTHAFKTNNKILWKIKIRGFPATPRSFMWLVVLKLLLHGIASK